MQCSCFNLFFSIIVSAIFLPACKSSFQVQHENIQSIKPEEHQAFKFFNPANQPPSNFSFSEENKKTLFDAVSNELKSRGFDSNLSASLLVKIEGGTVSEVQKNDSFNTYDPYYYRNWYYPYQNDSFYRDISRKQSTIIVNVLDAKSNKLMWQGVATGEMGKSINEVPAKLQEAVKMIFEEFPQ